MPIDIASVAVVLDAIGSAVLQASYATARGDGAVVLGLVRQPSFPQCGSCGGVGEDLKILILGNKESGIDESLVRD